MFSGAGANDAMRGQMSAYGDALIASGLSVRPVDGGARGTPLCRPSRLSPDRLLLQSRGLG